MPNAPPQAPSEVQVIVTWYPDNLRTPDKDYQPFPNSLAICRPDTAPKSFQDHSFNSGAYPCHIDLVSISLRVIWGSSEFPNEMTVLLVRGLNICWFVVGR